MLLEYLHVLNPFLMTMPRTFLEGRYFFTDSPTGLVNIKCPSAQLLNCSLAKNGHKATAFFMPYFFCCCIFHFIHKNSFIHKNIYCGSVDLQCCLCLGIQIFFVIQVSYV